MIKRFVPKGAFFKTLLYQCFRPLLVLLLHVGVFSFAWYSWIRSTERSMAVNLQKWKVKHAVQGLLTTRIFWNWLVNVASISQQVFPFLPECTQAYSASVVIGCCDLKKIQSDFKKLCFVNATVLSEIIFVSI